MANWFSKNLMKLNEEECYFMLHGEDSNEHSVKICQALIIESIEGKLLGVILDKKISFEIHVQQLCTKGSQKLHPLTRISPFMD